MEYFLARNALERRWLRWNQAVRQTHSSIDERSIGRLEYAKLTLVTAKGQNDGDGVETSPQRLHKKRLVGARA